MTRPTAGSGSAAAAPLPGGAKAVFDILTAGKTGTAMIAYRHLSDEERWAIAYFVDGLAKGAAPAR